MTTLGTEAVEKARFSRLKWAEQNKDRCAEHQRRYRAKPEVKERNREYQKSYDEKNADRRKAQKLEWARRNPERVKAKRKKWLEKPESRQKIRDANRALRINNKKSYLMMSARSRAKAAGLEFSIHENDLDLVEVCPVLGIALEYTNCKVSNNSPSIDRINSKNGYVQGNVRVISWRANCLKRDGTIEEFQAIIDYMRREAGQ